MSDSLLDVLLTPRLLAGVLGGTALNYSQKAAAIIAGSAIGWWKIAEPSGTTALDSSGNGRNGTHTSVTLAQTGIGDGLTAGSYPGTGCNTDIYSAGLAAAFSGTAGFVHLWFQASGAAIYTDGTEDRFITIQVDASNLLYIRKPTTNNQIDWRFTAGGTGTIRSKASISPTAWTALGLTWGGGNAQAYYNGVAEGAAWAFGTWAGSPAATSTVIGAATNTSTSPASGLLAHVILGTTKLTDAQMLALATVP